MSVSKDQTICPKCGRMYCEGFWGEGVCTADMYFGTEPTSAGDNFASYLRQWYEAHRETWWERSRFNSRGRQWEWASDNLMLGMMEEVRRIEEAAQMESEKRRNSKAKD